MFINAPSSTYKLLSTLNLSGNDTLRIYSGTLDLNSKMLTASGNPYRIIVDGGTLEIDSAAVLQFGGTLDSLILRNGTLRIVGVAGNEAKINKISGNYFIRLLGGTIEARQYEINGCGGGVGTYGVSFLNSSTSIHPTNNFSNGTFTGGTGAAYLNLSGYTLPNISVSNVRFNAGTGPTAVQFNVFRPLGSTGTITFVDATGSLAGATFESDAANQVFWSYPTGVYWTNAAGTGEWSNFRNWSSNTVPDDSTIVYLDHTYIAGAYTVNADSADARAKRLIINYDLGPSITLQIRRGYDLRINENLHIRNSATLILADNSDTVHIKGSWINDGTFTHNNGTVNFCGGNGTYSIVSGGTAVGKRFYNLIINANSASKYNFSQPVYVAGNLLINKGTLDQILPANTLTVSGNFTVNTSNNGFFNNGNSFVYFNGNNQLIDCTNSFYNIDFSGGTKTAVNNIDANNDITIQAGATFNGQDKIIYVGRNWSNFGTFTQNGAGTVIFDGTVAQAIDAAAGNATTFNNITLASTGAKNINRPFTVAGEFIISGGITGGVNFGTHIITGTATGLFSITGATLVSFYGYDNFPVGFGNISLASNSTVRYISDLDPQIVRMTDNWSYGNLTLQKQTASGAVVTKRVLAGNLIITGNLTIADVRTRLDMATNSANMILTGTIVMPTGGTQINWGTGTSTLTHVGGAWGIDPDITGFNNLILSGSSYKQMNNDLIITGNLEVRGGIIFYMYNAGNYRIFGPGDTLTLGDNAILYNRTAAPDTAFPTRFSVYNLSPSSTVVLNSLNGNNQIIYTGKNIQYGNLTFGNTKTVTHDGIADLIVKGNFNTNGSTYADNPSTPKNIFVSGGTVRFDYYTATPGVTLTLNGIIAQTLYSAGSNSLNLANVVFEGVGAKTLGDANDVVNISGNLTIQPEAVVTTTRNINFSGTNWNNRGVFTQTAGVTSFNSTSNQWLNPGPDNPQNYFFQIYFLNGSSKRIYNNGIRVIGRLAVRTPGLTLYMGSFTHFLAVDSFTVTAGAVHSDSSSFNFNRAGAQYINVPTFSAVNVSTSGTGIKYMMSNWTLRGDLTIGSGTTLTTNTAGYNIALRGNWINNGTFTCNTSTVTFNGNSSPITILSNGTAGGGNDFNYVNFNPTAPVTYNLSSPITRFRRTTTIGNNATLVLNGNTLYMGSNVASDKNLIINGTLTINNTSTLRINNQGSICTVDVYGRLDIVGNSSTSFATITSEVARNGNEPVINIRSGGTIAARYYLIELLANSGLNVMSGSNVDAVNNFSDGNWRNIALNNARYLSIETDNIPNPTINNVTFNVAGTPGVNLFNVSRTTATIPINFTNVTGNIGTFQYENDAVMPPSCSTGLLRWPCIMLANWTGAINTDWHTAGNWDINQVPDNNVDVVIPDRPNDPKITNNHAICKSLTITNGNLSLENNKHLYVSGDIIVGTANNVGVLSVASASDTIYVGGNWVRGNFGIFSHGGGTVVFNSSAGVANITPLTSRFNNIIIDNSATNFFLNGANITIDGSVSILNGKLYPGTNNYNLYVGGDFYVNLGASFMPTGGSVAAGTVIFNGNQNQVITNANFYNVTFDGTQTKAVQNNISIANIATVQTNATLKAEPASSIDFNGNVVIQNGATFNDGGETHYFSGLSWTNNGNYLGNGTLIFDRPAGTQTIVSGTFGNLTLQNYSTTIQNNINVLGNLILKNGSFQLILGTYQINNPTGTGNFIMEGNTRLYVRGANNFPSNFALYNLDPTSMVFYDGNVNQTIFPITYGILYLMSENVKTLGGDITVLSNLFLYNSTLDVGPNNFSITLEGNWNNNNPVSGVYGTFLARQGEVIFTGSANQYLYVNALANNNFNHITINKSSNSLICAYRPYTFNGNLNIVNGIFNPNGQTISIGGDLRAINGSISYSGSFILNKVTGTAYIQTNGSVLTNITINSPGGATYVALDNMDLRGNFIIQAGIFNGNGKYISLGDGATDAVTIQGTYIVGSGGVLALGNGTNLVVNNGGSIQVIGTPTNLAIITHNTIAGVGSRYGFTVNGNISAKYALFEYMNALGIYINTTGVIDMNNNFSYCTFDNGLNTGCMLRIENTQRLTGIYRINDVSFPTNPGGSAFNVRKISSAADTIEFYNASGIFAGETYDDDPNDLIIWTGPITLTWIGSVSTNWNDSLNWSASYGPPIVPTGNEHVIIAPATNQPIISKAGAKALNLTINNGASLRISTPTHNDSIDLQVKGDFYINGQFRLNSTNDIIGVMGNLVKGINGSITNNGTVIMNGTTGSKTINVGTLPFYNLTIAGNAVYQLGSNTVVRNDFSIQPGGNLSSNNFVLTVGGNWTNAGTFNAGLGRVVFNCNVLTTKYIDAGGSAFYDVDISTSRTTYKLLSSTTFIRNVSISAGGTLQLNGKTLTYGDLNVAAENFNINGTLIIDSTSTLRMGLGSSLIVNSGGNIRIIGKSANESALITSQIPATTGYGLTVYGGGRIAAKYYNIEYINANGIVISNGAYVDSVYNFSEGSFSYGQNGGYYLRYDCSFGGRNDSVFNVVFNAPISGSIRNVYRTIGTDLVVMVDASGAFGVYNYEYDQGGPGFEDPNTGLIRWVNKNTYYWTGAINTNWFLGGNWSSGLIPDSSKFVIIPNVTNKPLVSAGTARARKVTIQTGSSLTVADTIRIEQELLYYGNVIATGPNPKIYVGDNWTSMGGSFTAGNSTVILTAPSGTKDIKQGASAFNNLIIRGGSATQYKLNSNTTLTGSLTISKGNLNFNGYDLTVGGSWNSNGGSFTTGTKTVTFNAASGTHNINPSTSNFYNLVFNSGNGTGNATFTLGTTSPSTIGITNNLTINRGIVDLSPDGGVTSNNLNIGNRYYMTGGTLVARAGTITVGENWAITGTGIFTCGTSKVVFVASTGTKSISPRNQSFYDLQINGNALFRITNTLDVNNNLTISNGTFDVSTSPTYNVFVGGNWTNNATFIPQVGTVTFDGSSLQTISRAGQETFYSLTINNTGGGVSLANGNVVVSNLLTMTSGNINTGTYKLVVGTSTANPGNLTYTSGQVVGRLERWITATATNYIFPVGSFTEAHYAIIRPISGLTSGSVIMRYLVGDPGSTGLPLDEGADSVILQFSKGYWDAVAANGFACSNFNISLLANYFSTGTNYVNATSRILKRTNNGSWILEGTHQNATINTSDTICHRLGLLGISSLSTQFAIGATNCLGGQIAADQTICKGTSPSAFNNVVFPRGGSGVYTYTWQYTTNMSALPGDGSWIDIPSSNFANYTYTGAVNAPTKFVRKMSTPGCVPKYSNVLTINLYPVPTTGPFYRLPNKP
ncbi:MAG: hypothetical protein N2662_08485 [Bacteroidales bacterium]|nr:hypothetical protein [Bacteroidales bacterium]